MNPFKARKFRRAFYRSFPTVFRPTKRNYSPPAPMTKEDERNAGIGLLAFISLILIFILAFSR